MVVVCYISRLLNVHEINYGVAEKECLGVVWAVTKLRPYLYAKEFTVISDNHAVCSLMKMKCSKNRRLNRWLYTLSGHKLKIKYSCGKTRFIADCLSRNIDLGQKSTKTIKAEVKYLMHKCNLATLREKQYDSYAITVEDYRHEVLKAQRRDPIIQTIYNALAEGDSHLYPQYVVFDELVYYRNHKGKSWKLTVPKALVSRILYGFHDHASIGHMGRDRTLERVRRLFYWKSMNTDIENYIASCITCKQIKASYNFPPGKMKSHPVPSGVFDRIYFDVLGPLVSARQSAHKFCFVAIDQLSKFVVASSAKSYTAENVAYFLINKICFVFGSPLEICWDRHATHKSKLMAELTKQLHIIPNFSTAYNSTGAAGAERCIRSIENVLACYVSSCNQDWQHYLPSAIFALNTARHSSTGLSPYFLLTGRHPRVPYELGLTIPDMNTTYLEDLQKVREAVKFSLIIAQDKTRAHFNKKHLDIEFIPGDYVMVEYPFTEIGNSKKLSICYRGPFKILQKLSDQNYEISRLVPPYVTQIIHYKRLKTIAPRYEHLSDFDPASICQAPAMVQPRVELDKTEMSSDDLLDLNLDENPPTISLSRDSDNVNPTVSSLNPSLVTPSSVTITRSGRKVKPVVRFNI